MISSVNEIIKKYRKQQVPIPQLTDSVLSMSQTEVSQITDDNDDTLIPLFTEKDAYLQLKCSKEHVVHMLLNYQRQLAAPGGDFRNLKNNLNNQAKALSYEYLSTLKNLVDNGIVPGTESLLVMNVIEEFILRFSGLNNDQVPRYGLVQNVIKMNIKNHNNNNNRGILNDRDNQQNIQILLQNNDNKQKNQSKLLENELSTFLQLSNVSNINFTMQDDTFYRSNSNMGQRINGKIDRLRIRLEKFLQKEKLMNTRQILQDLIKDLDRLLYYNDIRDIKRIVYKLEQQITQLCDTGVSGNQTMGLYKLLQKAIVFSKKKEKMNRDCEIIEEKQESQVSERSTYVSRFQPQQSQSKVIGSSNSQDQVIIQQTQSNYSDQLNIEDKTTQQQIRTIEIKKNYSESSFNPIMKEIYKEKSLNVESQEKSMDIESYEKSLNVESDKQTSFNKDVVHSNDASKENKSNQYFEHKDGETLDQSQELIIENYNPYVFQDNTIQLNESLTKQSPLQPQTIKFNFVKEQSESFLVDSQQALINQKQLQSQFVHICLNVKKTLEQGHPGKKILVFQLFDLAQQQQIPAQDWQDWISKQMVS